jgi:hypothetical protein
VASRTDIFDIIEASPNREIPEPKRVPALNDSDEASDAVSRIDKVDPTRAQENKLSAEPKCATDRMLMELPKLAQFKIEMKLPVRTAPNIDSVLPQRA